MCAVSCNSSTVDSTRTVVECTLMTSPNARVCSTAQPSTVSGTITDHSGWPCIGDDDDCDEQSGDGLEPTPQQPSHPSSDFNFNTDDAGHHDDGGGASDRDDSTVNVVIQPKMTTIATIKHPTFTHKDTSAKSDDDVSSVKTKPSSSDVTPETSVSAGNSSLLNIALFIGVVLGLILLICILVYALYKYRSRDEGTYKIDETKNYRYESVNTKMPSQVNGSNGVATKTSGDSKVVAKKGTVKEWYV